MDISIFPHTDIDWLSSSPLISCMLWLRPHNSIFKVFFLTGGGEGCFHLIFWSMSFHGLSARKRKWRCSSLFWVWKQEKMSHLRTGTKTDIRKWMDERIFYDNNGMEKKTNELINSRNLSQTKLDPGPFVKLNAVPASNGLLTTAWQVEKFGAGTIATCLEHTAERSNATVSTLGSNRQ